jgi:hypothetical protein
MKPNGELQIYRLTLYLGTGCIIFAGENEDADRRIGRSGRS